MLRYFGPHKVYPSELCCGVELDEALGTSDGTVAGHMYFVSAPNHGILVDPAMVKVV
jgi:dynactin complex subunit